MTTLRVAVLVDLPRNVSAGGHVKFWERIGKSAAAQDSDIDLTIYFSGHGSDEVLSPKVRLRFLPPVFSTSRLRFLSYVPSHTDLATFHPALAQELATYDVIHTTDGFFSFARTAERIGRWNRIPLVTSFHTDILAYSEVFTRVTLEHVFGKWAAHLLTSVLRIPHHARMSKEKRLKKHLSACAAILAMRHEDIVFSKSVAPADHVKPLHLGVDKELFNAQRQDRNGIEREFGIVSGTLTVLFVGRVDVGKNMPMLLSACLKAIDAGIKLHLIVAGVGPLADEVKEKLGANVTLTGLIEPIRLAKIYASVDCLAIASDIEIGGMIGLEALAAGCPVLVSERSGVAQLCNDTPAMLKVESNVDAWTEALCKVARDPVQLSVMRDAAFMYRQSQLLGWGDVLNQDFIPVWRDVAQKRGS